MVSPLQFEAQHDAQWTALQAQLDALDALELGKARSPAASVQGLGNSIAIGYRAACEHLALARERGYPLHLADRLDTLTLRAHRLIYHRPPRGLHDLRHFCSTVFPQRLRAQWRYLLAAALAFCLPMLAVFAAVWFDASFALTLMDAPQLAHFDSMYGDEIGRASCRERV